MTTATHSAFEENPVKTSLGTIMTYVRPGTLSTPLVFLHGVYFDHTLWATIASEFEERTCILIDMPLHGKSQTDIKSNWSLTDCAHMLIEVLQALEIETAIGIGHSWGSMTLLRAAAQNPEKFSALGFCNMPTEPANTKTRLQFKFQHLLIPFRGFYAKQVAKAMFDRQSRLEQPQLQSRMAEYMNKLPGRSLRQTDQSVILNADSAQPYLEKLSVPALALRGTSDYVPETPGVTTRTVNSRHVSPLEAPKQVVNFIKDVVALA